MAKKLSDKVKKIIKGDPDSGRIKWSLYGRVWREIGRPYAKWLGLGIIFTLLAAGAEAYTITLVQQVVDKAFIGCGGCTIDHGITDYSSDSAELHTAIVQRAKQSILVTDSSKFGRDAFAVIGPVDCVDMIITDSGISPEYADAIRSRGIELKIVE